MPRTTRIYAPGVAFHVVGVTQGRQRWFVDDIADRIVSDIDQAAAAAGHRILARTVMPNHFHIIVKQSNEPLGWMMQRVMQRAANGVKRRHSHEGHVFQARYWAEPVSTPDYLRRAIFYTHDNPCKAGICSAHADYKWSSHSEYLRIPVVNEALDVGFRDGLMLFADDSLDVNAALSNYLRFVEVAEERRRLRVAGDWLLPGCDGFDRVPPTPAGNAFWLSSFTNFSGDVERPRKRVYVRGVAERMLRQIDPQIPIEAVRFTGPKSQLAEVRKQLVCAMLTAGCNPSQIARFLNISPSYVSYLRRHMRFSGVIS